jgi:hypothetical protein
LREGYFHAGTLEYGCLPQIAIVLQKSQKSGHLAAMRYMVYIKIDGPAAQVRFFGPEVFLKRDASSNC